VARLDSEALVLRVVDLGESDRIAHLLTPETSRLTVIAKGARRSRRRFPGALDLLCHAQVQVERRRPQGMARLEQARLLDPFAGLRADPARFALACYVAELVDRLAPEGAGGADARRLFAVALGALRAIAAGRPDARLRVLLEIRVLAALGLAPELGRCVRCGSALQAGVAALFSVAEGGALCARCARPGDAAIPIGLGTLRALAQSLRLELPQLSRLGLTGAALDEARGLVARFLRYHVGLELRSEPVLDRLLVPERRRAPAPRGRAPDAS
jgi:DNA repair protein RecO (recombination protein O)